jgi:hypothetical protein
LEGQFDVVLGAVVVLFVFLPPLVAVGAHDDPLVLPPVHLELVGLAEDHAGPPFVKVAQDDARVLLFELAQSRVNLVGEALGFDHLVPESVQFGH